MKEIKKVFAYIEKETLATIDEYDSLCTEINDYLALYYQKNFFYKLVIYLVKLTIKYTICYGLSLYLLIFNLLFFENIVGKFSEDNIFRFFYFLFPIFYVLIFSRKKLTLHTYFIYSPFILLSFSNIFYKGEVFVEVIITSFICSTIIIVIHIVLLTLINKHKKL